MGAENSKILGRNDIEDRLVVLQSWMNILMPLFENGMNEVPLTVLCWLGYTWEFRCKIRNDRYARPALQAREWKRFVNYVGLQEGDRIILLEEENQQRGTKYCIRAQRMDANNQWADVQPPTHDNTAFYQFNI